MCSLAVKVLSIYPKELKVYVRVKAEVLRTQIFVVVLFRIAKTWKQPRHSSVAEWENKLCYIYTVQYWILFSKEGIELPSHEKI